MWNSSAVKPDKDIKKEKKGLLVPPPDVSPSPSLTCSKLGAGCRGGVLQGALGPELPLAGNHGWAGSSNADREGPVVSGTAASAPDAFHSKASSPYSSVPTGPAPQ
ncbi:E3 ubiquitin-protein ligase SH3RF1 [Microtus ochrogaster]|uniref:E3 ubiquitin-protein ligase SH3RF1 n=1 Tax=Microtus ochrogaster TaxID=79684 RepID=A0A8J6KVP5_MICOH|nr:E3 ubiquitin-protein ligase SH3RF1 [Microtus ochrogaster]